MYLIESFLTKIVYAIIRKAITISISPFFDPIFRVYSTYSLFQDVKECVDSRNDISDLLINGMHVVSETLTNEAVDRFLSIGNETFVVEQTGSGVLIASKLVPDFITTDIEIPLKKNKIHEYDERIQARCNYDKNKININSTYDPISHYSKVIWCGEDSQGWCVYKKDPHTSRVIRIDFKPPNY